MDEARKVIRRLRRIELLEQECAPAPALLGEVRELLHEAEDWVRAEPGGTERAEDALDRCRRAVDAPSATPV